MLPTLRTARLILRPAHADDVAPLWRLWRSPEVRRYLWDDREILQAEAAQVVEDLLALAPHGMGLWVVERPAAGEATPDDASPPVPIGCAALSPASTTAQFEPAIAGLVEPLVALAPSQWGRGFAAEVLAALVSYAFEALEVAELAGATDVPNTASDRMLRRLGFVPFSEVPGPRYPMRIYRLARPPALPAPESAPQP